MSAAVHRLETGYQPPRPEPTEAEKLRETALELVEMYDDYLRMTLKLYEFTRRIAGLTPPL